ncbi:MAG: putative tricarboxylic transport rane protein [Alphaproteobacteria bacterium]|jgi:putative tricarboxylic transport membrane protein|nr:putative tricarboxylic transport rane protein [Alphaproteobacteria bacterium]
MDGRASGTRSASAFLVALAVVGLGLFVLHQGYSIGVEQSAYARVGPQVFPYVIGAGLIAIGALLARSALNRSWSVNWVETSETGPDRREFWRHMSSVGLVGLGLVINAAFIAPLGFVIASTLMFALTTRAFGSRRLFFDLAVGAVFSAIIFITFTYALGLSLPGGTLWGAR